MKKGLEERDTQGCPLGSQVAEMQMPFTAMENNEGNGCKGKITILRLSGDVQEALGNTVIGCNREVWEGNADQGQGQGQGQG